VDFTTGLVALCFILMLYILLWNSIALRWNRAAAQEGMETSAYLASESLLATPGEPESWEMLPAIDGNVSAIGLVNGRNELDRLKLERMAQANSTSYSLIKARLGMQRYEFGMRITDLGGNDVHFEFGKFSIGSSGNAIVFERFGILDGEPVIVHLEVWSG
jgi:hypothetical protein